MVNVWILQSPVVNFTTDNLKNGRFHQHLQDTFAPLVVRYVDLMESSIAQSIHKGFEKERWELKGQGVGTSEDLFWKLDALQAFIRDLHWPNPGNIVTILFHMLRATYMFKQINLIWISFLFWTYFQSLGVI